jgi:4-carboxymuconolactone decarboxylase
VGAQGSLEARPQSHHGGGTGRDYRPEQLVSHLSRAIANGVAQEEITEVITHMAFYAGWPAAMSAAQVAYTVLVEDNEGE